MSNDNRRSDRRSDQNRREPEFLEQVIALDRVTRVVKGGRRFRFRALVVIGDGKLRVGVGVSKGGDVQGAISKAVAVAKKNMITIDLNETTVPHEVIGRHSASRVLLKPASEGTGLIAGGTVRTILDVTGLKNVLSKSMGSSTKINVAYATMDALRQLQGQAKWVGASSKKAEKKAAKKDTDKPKADAAKKPAAKAKVTKEKKSEVAA